MRSLFVILSVWCAFTGTFAQKSPEGRRLIRCVIRNNNDYDRLNFRNCTFIIEYNGLQLPEVKGNVKFVRDSAIQISIVPAFGIEAGRILLTRDSIFIINRLSKWYIRESWKDAGLEDLKKLKMSELQDIFLGELPSRSRWLLRKDSVYKLNEVERAYQVRTGKSDWHIQTVLNNSSKKLVYLNGNRSTTEKFGINYIRGNDWDESSGELNLKGTVILLGYSLRGSIRLSNGSEDRVFRVGAGIGQGYSRKSFNSLKKGK
jgi:hypothetical protein